MARDKIHIDLVLNTKGFRPLGRINGQLGEFEKSLDASNARVLAFGASAGAILAVKKAFTATVKAAIEVEKSLMDINVILGATSQNLKKFGSELFEIASKTGQAFQVAAVAATELARQGLGTEETLKRTRDALILARLAGMDATEAVNALTAAINTFNKAGLDSTTIINKLANVDAAFAVSSDDLARAIGRVGSSAKAAGVNFDQLLAIVTTVQQKTARGGAVIGNSFKTIFTRIQRPKVIKQLESLGIAIRGVEGDVLPAMKVLQNLARQFDNLSQAQRAQITELIGGVFQVNILKAAMSDLSNETGIYNKALGVSIGSSDQALRRNEELNKTLAAQFQRTVNTFKEGAAELGELTLGPSLERMFGFVDDMSKIGESDFGKVGVSIAKSIFEGLGKFISGPGLLVIGLVLFKTFSQLGKFAADAFKTLTGLNKSLQTQQALQRQVFDVLSENPDLLKKIKDGAMTVEQAHEEIYKQIHKNTGALDAQLLVSNQIAKSLAGGGVGFSSDFGATSGKKSRKFGSAGYVPSFAAERGEVLGMMAGGYSRSQIKNPKTRQESIHNGRGGVFNATVNGHESVFTKQNSQGKKATFVVPPKNSKAYDKYMSVLSSGFIPNFRLGIKGFGKMNLLEQQQAALKKFKSKDFKALSAADKKIFKEDMGPIFDRKYGTTGTSEILRGSKDSINETAHGKNVREQANIRASLDKKGNQQFVDIRGGKLYKYEKGQSAKSQKDPGTVGKAVHQKGTKIFDAQGKFGLLGMFGVKKSNRGYAEAPIDDIKEIKNAASRWKGIQKIGFQNLQYRSLSGLSDKNQTSSYSKAITSRFATPTQRLAGDIAKGMLPGKGLKPARISPSGPPLFPVDAEGNILETAINALTSKGAQFSAALGADKQQTWDFRKSFINGNDFRKNFDFSKSLMNADAKRSLTAKAESSIVKKIFSTKSEDPWHQEIKNRAGGKKKAKAKVKAGGYIPNFNALHEAVRREKEAGVPTGKIKVGRSDRLRTGGNPSGFGVYNTRDEPMGLNQGINNSMAAGIDPKRKGMAGGYFPNFAPPWNKGVTKKEVTGAGFSYDKSGVEAFKKGAESTDKLTKATRNNTSSAMGTMVMMGLLQQGVTGLSNSVGEQNNKTKGVIDALGALAATVMAAKFASSEMQSMGMGKLGKKATARVESGEQTLGQALSQRNTFEHSKRNVARDKKFGKKGGGLMMMGRRTGSKALGMASRGAGAVGGMAAGAAASGALVAGVASLAALNQFGKVMSQTDFSDTFKEARVAGKALEKIKEETEKNIAKLSKFGSAAEQAAKTFEDSNATMSQVLDASRQMEREMAKLPLEFSSKLSGIFDPNKVNKMIEGFVAEQQKKAGVAQRRKGAADLMENTRDKDVYDIFASPIKSLSNLFTAGNLSGKTDEEIAMDSKSVDSQSAGMLQRTISGDKNRFLNMDTEKFLKETGGAKTQEERQKAGENLGLNEADLAIWSKFAQKGGNEFRKMAKGMAKLVTETKQRLETEIAMKPIREDLLKQNREQMKAMKDHKKVLESEQRVRKAVIKITSAGAKSFLTAAGQINLDTKIKVGEARADKETQFGGLISQSQKALGSALSNAKNGLAGTSLESGIKGTLSKAAQGGIGSVSAASVDSQVAGLDKMIEDIQSNEGADTTEAKQQIDELQGLKSELQNLVGSSERLDGELKMQTKEIKAAAAAQKMVADQQRRLKSFGGPQALLDPSKMNPMLSKIVSGGKAMSASARSGSVTGFNRGKINQLSGVQDMLGGELPEHLRRKGVAAATQVGVSQIGAANQALGLGMTPEQVKKAAVEQANNLFKGDPQKQNTSALETLNTTLKENSDIVKHSRTDRIDMAGRESSYSERSSGRQRGFMAATQKRDKNGNLKAVDEQSKFARLQLHRSGMNPRHESSNWNPFKYTHVQSNWNALTGNDTAYKPTDELWNGKGKEGVGGLSQKGLDGIDTLKAEAEQDARDTRSRYDNSPPASPPTDPNSAPQASVNNFNFPLDPNAPVSTDGPVSVASIDQGINGLQELKNQLNRHEGALGNMPGGTAALNQQQPVA